MKKFIIFAGVVLTVCAVLFVALFVYTHIRDADNGSVADDNGSVLLLRKKVPYEASGFLL